MKRLAVLLSVTVRMALGVIGATMLYAQPEPGKRTLLMRGRSGGERERNNRRCTGRVRTGSSGKYRHPVDTFLYVLDGSLRLEERGKSP